MDVVLGLLTEVGAAVVDATLVRSAAAKAGMLDHPPGAVGVDDPGGWSECLLHAFLGAVAGVFSLGVAPDAVLPTATLRTANLVAAPLTAGFLSARLAGAAGLPAPPAAYFWRGFATTTALV